MRLYVPEIGDIIVLEQPWKFRLHAEDRNRSVAGLEGYYLGPGYDNWIKESEIPQMREADYYVVYPNQNDFTIRSFFGNSAGNTFNNDAYNKARNEAQENNKEYVKYYSDLKEWRKKCKTGGVKFIEVEFPIGTELKIDRIYIRKGASDYSSISFYALNLGEVTIKDTHGWHRERIRKFKKLRFWTKLSDCNNIIFKDGKGEKRS